MKASPSDSSPRMFTKPVLTETNIADLAKIAGRYCCLSILSRRLKDVVTYETVLPVLNASMSFLGYTELPDKINDLEYSRLASRIHVNHGSRALNMFYFWYHYQLLLSVANNGAVEGLSADKSTLGALGMLVDFASNLGLPPMTIASLKDIEAQFVRNQFIPANEMRDIQVFILRNLSFSADTIFELRSELFHGTVPGSSITYGELYQKVYLAGELIATVSRSFEQSTHERVRDITSLLDLFSKLGLFNRVPSFNSLIGPTFHRLMTSTNKWCKKDFHILQNWAWSFLMIRFGAATAGIFDYAYNRDMFSTFLWRWSDPRFIEYVKFAADRMYDAMADIGSADRIAPLLDLVSSENMDLAAIQTVAMKQLDEVDGWLKTAINADNLTTVHITFSQDLREVIVNGKKAENCSLTARQRAIVKHCLELKAKGINVFDFNKYQTTASSMRLVDVFRSRKKLYNLLFESTSKGEHLIKF